MGVFCTCAVMYNAPLVIVFIIVQSCMEVLSMWGTSCVRDMGRDARSVIRAVLYAAMIDNLSVVKTSGNLNDCCQVIDYHFS